MIPLSVELQFSATRAIYRGLTGDRGHGLEIPRTGLDNRAPLNSRGSSTVTAVRPLPGSAPPSHTGGTKPLHQDGYAEAPDRHAAPERATPLPKNSSAVDVEISFAAPSMG